MLVVSFALASAGFAEQGNPPSTLGTKDERGAALADRNRDRHGNMERADRSRAGSVERITAERDLSPTGPGADYNPDGPQPGDLSWPGY